MEIRTKSYQLKINIRDTQGVDGPTRIMILVTYNISIL